MALLRGGVRVHVTKCHKGEGGLSQKFEPKFCLSGEDFDEDTPIIILKCGHFSEKEALLEWIKIANICPFCRVNLGF